MDQYRQIGPEKGDYDDDVQRVARELMNGETVHVALTHRMTRQSLVLAFASSIAKISPVEGLGQDMFLLVVRPEKGAYWFRIDHFQTPDYIAARMGVHLADAETISDFLARLGEAVWHTTIARPAESVL